jgi:hypothetical protein
MGEQISNDNPVTETTDNQSNGPASSANGTVQPGGQVNGQASPAVENLGGLDPNRLPPELRQSYDAMLRDYRSKTAKVADTVKSEVAKAVEAYRQKAEFYDQFSGQDEFVKQWNEYVQRTQNAQNDQTSDPVQQKIHQMERQQAELAMEVQASKVLEEINAFADMKDEKGQLLHADFDKLASLKIGNHPQAGDYDLLRAAVELSPGRTPKEKMENGYKAAKAIYDSIFEEGRKAGLGRVQSKIKNGMMSPSSVNATPTAPGRPKNALEALQFARQGLIPNRG